MGGLTSVVPEHHPVTGDTTTGENVWGLWRGVSHLINQEQCEAYGGYFDTSTQGSVTIGGVPYVWASGCRATGTIEIDVNRYNRTHSGTPQYTPPNLDSQDMDIAPDFTSLSGRTGSIDVTFNVGDVMRKGLVVMMENTMV